MAHINSETIDIAEKPVISYPDVSSFQAKKRSLHILSFLHPSQTKSMFLNRSHVLFVYGTRIVKRRKIHSMYSPFFGQISLGTYIVYLK